MLLPGPSGPLTISRLHLEGRSLQAVNLTLPYLTGCQQRQQQQSSFPNTCKSLKASFICLVQQLEAPRSSQAVSSGSNSKAAFQTLVKFRALQGQPPRGGHLRPQMGVFLSCELSVVAGTGNNQAQYPEVALADST